MTREQPTEELLAVELTPELSYQHTAGRYGSVFLKALKDGVILGSKCRECGTVQAPPRIICGSCWKETRDLVEVGPGGNLLAYTQVTLPFIDPFTGEGRPVPYCYGMIQLDGADNSFQHFLAESEIEKVSFGMRVEAVFRPADKRLGRIDDIRCFKTAGAAPGAEAHEPESDTPLDGAGAGKGANGSVARLQPFIDLFNQAIPTRELAPLLALFSEDAHLTVKLLGSKEFRGHAQIEQAFRGLPRKSTLSLLDESAPDATTAKARFLLKGLPIRIKGTLTAKFAADGRIIHATLASG